MMTKGNTNFSNETEKFNHAVDLFFGMNPEKRLWILLMFYLAKERALRIVDNYDGTGGFQLMAYMLIDDISDKTVAKRWAEQGIRSRAIIADAPNTLDCHFDELAYAIDLDSHNNAQVVDGTTGIFSKYRWEAIYLVEISEILISLSDEWYTENSAWAFDSLIKRISNKYGREVGIFSQPKELTDLIGKILDAKAGSVYNPYAGIASYAMTIGKDCSYIGQEFSSISNAIGKLNLLVNGKTNSSLELCIPERHWRATNQEFDYIVSTPPFGMRIPDSSYGTAELQFLADSSRDTLHKSVGVYPASICINNKESNRSVISNLVDNDILESVIILPENILSTSRIETVIIVINKRKERKGQVMFVDASDCYLKEGRYNTLLADDIMSRIDGDVTPSKTRFVSNSDIRSNNYLIYPSLYTSVEEITFPEGYNVLELGDIIEAHAGSRRHNDSNGYLATISGLSSKGTDGIRKATDFENTVFSSPTTKVVEPVLLISMIREPKPTYCFASEEEPIHVHPNVAIYKIKSGYEWVSPGYLCYELSRRTTNTTSGVIPRISKEILLKTKLGFPSYIHEEQERILNEAIHQEKLAKARELGLQEIIDSMKAEYINEVKSRKHDTKPYFRELRSVERRMRRYVSTYDSMSDFQERMNDVLDMYHTALEALSNLVNIFSEEEKFGKAERFDINQYFSKLLEGHDAESTGFKLHYNQDENSLHEAGLLNSSISSKEFSILNGFISFKSEKIECLENSPLYIDIAPIDFERMVKNIIENAREHGFTNPEENNYELEINLSYDSKSEMFQIDFINNGNPLPSGLDKLRYGLLGEKAGSTGGSGRGGHIVKSIVTHYNGDYDVFMDDDNTVIRVLLPISKQDNE